MLTRHQFIEKLTTDLHRWNAHAAAWELKTRRTPQEIRAAYERQMAAFRAQRARSLRKLRELRGSTDRAWRDLSQSAEESWQLMRQVFEQTRLHFDQARAR